MDNDRFDDLSRKLAQPRSRREALSVLGAAVAGLVFGKSADAAPKADKPSKCYGGDSHCTNAKQCCSGICTNRQCAPEIPPECNVASDCTDLITDCQAHTCTAGVCGVENFGAGFGCSAGVCDGSGTCVQCLANTDCLSGLCDSGVCAPSCLDNINLGGPCTDGIGECIKDGYLVCAEDGVSLVCDAVALDPGTETCNGLDDDCDGDIDNDVICPPLSNATSGCIRGECVPVLCNSGYGNCDFDSSTGCETNIQNDVAHCGGCNRSCPTGPNSTSICNHGTCQITCSSGFDNCNGNSFDGCETNTMTDMAHCGGCYQSCPSTGECRSGTCCISNFAPIVAGIECCSGAQFAGFCVGL